MTFGDVVLHCAAQPELVANYDRLRGTNLSRRGTDMDLLIDDACKRTESEIPGFVAFVWECVWTRLPPEAFSEVTP